MDVDLKKIKNQEMSIDNSYLSLKNVLAEFSINQTDERVDALIDKTKNIISSLTYFLGVCNETKESLNRSLQEQMNNINRKKGYMVINDLCDKYNITQRNIFLYIVKSFNIVDYKTYNELEKMQDFELFIYFEKNNMLYMFENPAIMENLENIFMKYKEEHYIGEFSFNNSLENMNIENEKKNRTRRDMYQLKI